MKRLILALGITVGLIGILNAADPASPISNTVERADTTSAFTFSSQLSSAGFVQIDSLIDVCSDTGVFVLMASGYAILEENQIVYLGLGNDSANCVDSATCATTGLAFSNLDTLTLKAPDNMEGSIWIPFFLFETINTLVALTDTFYLNAATGSGSYTVQLKDVKFTCDIHD